MSSNDHQDKTPDLADADSPAAPSRRSVLRGLGLAGGGAALGAFAVAAPAAAQSQQQPPGRDAEAAEQVQPFYGPHQAGIVNPVPAAGLVAAFDVLATSRADLERMFRTLTERIAFLMAGGTPPEIDPKFPPPDSGVLGPVIVPDNLTVTVAVGASLFDQRFGLAGVKPLELTTMVRFSNDALDPETCHGDLMLQFCANTPEANIHALRAVVKATPDLLALRWKLDGFLPAATKTTGPKETARNLLGFKDGTANLDPTDGTAMDRIVWVRPDTAEPAWTVGGSYQVVRIIRNFVERWDRTPLQEQQTIIGRDKASGAALGLKAEHDVPDYSGDPEGKVMPLDAHIRLANPRTAATEANLILRRPFNYSRGVTKAGQLDMGLLFISFQSSLKAGFIAVQERLNGEPLEEYIKPTGGGYFFTLPGVPDKDGYLGQGLLQSAAS
ncbi:MULTISPECIES: iron uptake transporter deferrochelatase/peroxidase subunit [Inquilinus]|uniref:Deferrochelatase n=1 Tax=Inquilinus ginsengisoli TaxID=363840 RepID=A0ABU1K0X4_9PROT|nr:iron uptake transporter deferrochelatase/peroxidase subunit [Inquilinus ginsengisoli]MDR6294517.1 deferrochelatase/peroxidase EfeB [Inquilinus ginsengisoli]